MEKNNNHREREPIKTTSSENTLKRVSWQFTETCLKHEYVLSVVFINRQESQFYHLISYFWYDLFQEGILGESSARFLQTLQNA